MVFSGNFILSGYTLSALCVFFKRRNAAIPGILWSGPMQAPRANRVRRGTEQPYAAGGLCRGKPDHFLQMNND
jgi:hypothetical protein